jgi:MFS transporter, FHS family, glucose/mannose:H+ symporter
MRVAQRAQYSLPTFIYGLGLAIFFIIGMSQSLYGPALSDFQQRFAVAEAEVGWLISAHFIGMIIVTLGSGPYLRHGSYRTFILIGLSCLVLGCSGIYTAPFWGLALLSAFCIGLGFGAINVSFTLLAGDLFVERRVAALSTFSAMIGLGAIAGPLLIVALGTGKAFLLTALFALVATVPAWTLPPSVKRQGEARATKAGHPFIVVGFVLLYLIYVGSEAGIGSWGATHLTPLLGSERAAFFTSLFWLALTLGRLITVPISMYVRSSTLLIASLGLGAGAMGLAYQTNVAPFAYILAGLALAPVFPTGLAWIRQVFPSAAASVTSLVLVSAAFGGVIFPPAIGFVVGQQTASWIPGTIAVIMLACLVVVVMLSYLIYKTKSASKPPILPPITPGGWQERQLRTRRVEQQDAVTLVHHPLYQQITTSKGGEKFRNDVCWHGFVLARTLLETTVMNEPTVIVFPRGGVATGVGAKLALRGFEHHFFTVKMSKGVLHEARLPETIDQKSDVVLVDGIVATGNTLISYLDRLRSQQQWRGRLFVLSNLAAEEGIEALETYAKRHGIEFQIVTGAVIPVQDCAWKELGGGKKVYFVGVKQDIGDFGDMNSDGLGDNALLEWQAREPSPEQYRLN